MKSAYKLIYGYLAVTYATLFLGVLISDTLYREEARILCASSVPRLHVPGIMNVPTFVPWLLFGLIPLVVPTEPGWLQMSRRQDPAIRKQEGWLLRGGLRIRRLLLLWKKQVGRLKAQKMRD